MCQEPKEFKARGRKVTIAEAWLLCRKHHPPRQTCQQQTALGKRSQGTVRGSEQKGWCTVELVSERIPHLQSFWISRQEQQLVINWEEHHWQPRKRLWSQNSGPQTLNTKLAVFPSCPTSLKFILFRFRPNLPGPKFVKTQTVLIYLQFLYLKNPKHFTKDNLQSKLIINHHMFTL